MKKIVLIFLLFPFLGWSQRTIFTDQQHKFVDAFYEKFENIDPAIDMFVLELEDALKTVPYHPNFVQTYLRAKFNLNDFKFISNYCNQLDNNYLSTFQPILVDVCACGYFFNNDYYGLYHRIIPLIEDEETKQLFLTAYYLGIENYEQFIQYAKSTLAKNYRYRGQMILRDHLFGYFIAILQENGNRDHFLSFNNSIKDYEEAIFSSELDLPIYYILIQSAIFNDEFTLARRLINYVEKLDRDNYKYLSPISALFYSYKGMLDLAVMSLESALKLDETDVEMITSTGYLSLDIFSSYSMSIRKIDDYITKERLVKEAITSFEKRHDYWVRFKLYHSLLLASKDINKAKTVLKECESYLVDQNITDLGFLLLIENELAKENPNYRLIDDLMRKMFHYNNFPEIIFQRIQYRYKVNFNSKKSVFSLNEMVDDFDKILNFPLSREARLRYLRFKIVLIAEFDRPWAERELENLPLDEAEEIISDLESTKQNQQKISEILISDTKELLNISENINILNVGYINAIRLKK